MTSTIRADDDAPVFDDIDHARDDVTQANESQRSDSQDEDSQDDPDDAEEDDEDDINYKYLCKFKPLCKFVEAKLKQAKTHQPGLDASKIEHDTYWRDCFDKIRHEAAADPALDLNAPLTDPPYDNLSLVVADETDLYTTCPCCIQGDTPSMVMESFSDGHLNGHDLLLWTSIVLHDARPQILDGELTQQKPVFSQFNWMTYEDLLVAGEGRLAVYVYYKGRVEEARRESAGDESSAEKRNSAGQACAQEVSV